MIVRLMRMITLLLFSILTKDASTRLRRSKARKLAD
jgi:hypothetical protein